MEDSYKISTPKGTYVYEESDIKALFNLTDINDIYDAEFKKIGLTATKLTKEETDAYWEQQRRYYEEREQRCTCSDCGSSGKKSNMEWGDKGYVCLTCWDKRALSVM